MMASAAACHVVALAERASDFITEGFFPAGSDSPITPVEARKTSFGRLPISADADCATAAAALAPDVPVNALAFPLLTTSALALPWLTCFRHHSTGADAICDWVNTPATCVPGSRVTSRRSSRLR